MINVKFYTNLITIKICQDEDVFLLNTVNLDMF